MFLIFQFAHSSDSQNDFFVFILDFWILIASKLEGLINLVNWLVKVNQLFANILENFFLHKLFIQKIELIDPT